MIVEEKKSALTNTCNFREVKPIMADLPYPPIRVQAKNQMYADLLSVDYSGSVSELSAIAQYINQENCLSCEKCSFAKTILGIAMAEMIHLQKLSELIFLLGGTIDFCARYRDGKVRMWTPDYLKLSEDVRKMLAYAIESEQAAIRQYKSHRKMIRDCDVNAVLNRIIQDEEYHIMILEVLCSELGR